MLVLASNSPRRKKLLGFGGWGFSVLSAPVDESAQAGESAESYVLRLAESKARAASHLAEYDNQVGALIIAADTAVVQRAAIDVTANEYLCVNNDCEQIFQETILGKPAEPEEAEVMLRTLRGRTHQVYSGVAILCTENWSLHREICVTDVPMRDYSDDEMLVYIQSGDPLDKAGAYAIQHPGFHPVESLDGCYANVMGLPVCHLTRLLIELGIHPATKVSEVCQQSLNYDCPVYKQILHEAPTFQT